MFSQIINEKNSWWDCAFKNRGVTSSLEDVNANTIKVTSNIPLPYENKLDGWKWVREKKKVSLSGYWNICKSYQCR